MPEIIPHHVYGELAELRDKVYKLQPDFPRGLTGKQWRLEFNKRFDASFPPDLSIEEACEHIREVLRDHR